MKNLLFYSILIITTIWTSTSIASQTITAQPSIFANLDIIDTEKAKKILASALRKQGLEKKLAIKIKGYDKGIKIGEKHHTYQAQVIDLDINKKTRRFKSRVSFKSDSYLEIINIDGSYEEIVKIPVINSALPFNTVISESDLEFTEIPKHRIKYGYVTDPNLLIGYALKRTARKMRPIKRRDIIKQQLVTRSGLVNIQYKTPTITLQTLGVAMDNGSKGDIIRVRNTESNKIVKATISTDKLVIVNSEIL